MDLLSERALRAWRFAHQRLRDVLRQALPEPELDAESRAAFDTAYDNIRAFHEAQRAADVEVETMPGVRCRRITRPIGAPTHCGVSSVRWAHAAWLHRRPRLVRLAVDGV